MREQFGQVIGAFRAVKHVCAEMRCGAEVAEALAWDAATATFGPQHRSAAVRRLVRRASPAGGAARDSLGR